MKRLNSTGQLKQHYADKLRNNENGSIPILGQWVSFSSGTQIIKNFRDDSNQFETIFFLGTLYAQQKKFEKALELLNKGIQINPKVADLYNNMGLIYKEMREFDQSLKYFKKAVEVNKNFAIAFSNLALVYKDLKNFKESEKNFLIAIERNPNNFDFYNNLGNVIKILTI
jgi:Tetratricopeptide repeat.